MCVYIYGTTIGFSNGDTQWLMLCFGGLRFGALHVFRDSEEEPATNLGPTQEFALVGAMLIGGPSCRGDVWLSVQVAASFCVACNAL